MGFMQGLSRSVFCMVNLDFEIDFNRIGIFVQDRFGEPQQFEPILFDPFDPYCRLFMEHRRAIPEVKDE